VSGVLLYAKTDEEIVPDNDFLLSGSRISVKTLDMNTDFSNITCSYSPIPLRSVSVHWRCSLLTDWPSEITSLTDPILLLYLEELRQQASRLEALLPDGLG
jgi:hypothetical protein